MVSDLPTVATSLSLLGRVSRSETGAWARFARLYTPLIYTWARRAKLSEADSADVSQDVLYAVSTGIRKYEQSRGSGFRGWLWGITRHKIVDQQRRNSQTPVGRGGSTAQAVFQSVADPEEPNLSEALADIARRASALVRTDFRENTWKAFWGTTVENRTAAEMAAELGMSVASVYTAKSRVLSHLRRELELELPSD